MVTNLLENAIKYSPQGGCIAISVGQQGEQAYLSVTDQGIGIPTEAVPHLFERFYRATNVSSGPSTGMGLGLYFCQRIVAQHGGRIEVESQPDSGSRFTVWLPFKPQDPQDPSPSAPLAEQRLARENG